MKALYIFLLILIVIITGCNKEKLFDGPDSIIEDFEDINNINDLFPDDYSRWAYYQQTLPENYIEIDTLNPHTGKKCLKIFAAKGTVSKSDLAKNKMAFWQNDIVQFSAWYFIEGTNDLNFVFLFDIEEDAVIGAGPGIRIALDAEGFIVIERNKYMEATIEQANDSKVAFPRNQWVELRAEIKLTQKDNGYIKLWQDGVQLIDAKNVQTLPKDKLYYIQGTKGMYQSIQVGVTATTSDSDVIMFIDDIEIKKINN